MNIDYDKSPILGRLALIFANRLPHFIERIARNAWGSVHTVSGFVACWLNGYWNSIYRRTGNTSTGKKQRKWFPKSVRTGGQNLGPKPVCTGVMGEGETVGHVVGRHEGRSLGTQLQEVSHSIQWGKCREYLHEVVSTFAQITGNTNN